MGTENAEAQVCTWNHSFLYSFPKGGILFLSPKRGTILQAVRDTRITQNTAFKELILFIRKLRYVGTSHPSIHPSSLPFHKHLLSVGQIPDSSLGRGVYDVEP